MRELVDGNENEGLNKAQRYQTRRLCCGGERPHREIERIVGWGPVTRSISNRTKLHAEKEHILACFRLHDSIALEAFLANHGEPLVYRREVRIAKCLVIMFRDKDGSHLLHQKLAR